MATSLAQAIPAVSVSLVTFNGVRWLDGCLGTLREQDMPRWELLVVDNASTDATWERLQAAWADDPRVSLTRLGRNEGFAAAHNRNIERARAPFVVLLNQDLELDPAFLKHALAAFDGRPTVAAVQGRLRRLGRDGSRSSVLDSTGLTMGRDRRVVARSQGVREGDAHLAAGEVWGADGPAPTYRADALRDARLPKRGGGWEVLDEDFFMYKEDVDLAWRLRILGWDAWYEPAALAWHARGVKRGGPIPTWIRAASWRNQRLMQAKNETLGGYLRDMPWIARHEVLALGGLVIRDPRSLVAIPSLVRRLPWAMRKRRALWRRINGRRGAAPSS